ncbi:peptidase, partial [Azotobacter chroococcum]|nr:peptidase [Azotobacter chroococcum]
QALVDSAAKGQHFDQLIAADNAAGQQLVRETIAALVKQTGSIEQAAARLGIGDLSPDSAAHSF